jgi:hypothetical protein
MGHVEPAFTEDSSIELPALTPPVHRLDVFNGLSRLYGFHSFHAHGDRHFSRRRFLCRDALVPRTRGPTLDKY